MSAATPSSDQGDEEEEIYLPPSVDTTTSIPSLDEEMGSAPSEDIQKNSLLSKGLRRTSVESSSTRLSSLQSEPRMGSTSPRRHSWSPTSPSPFSSIRQRISQGNGSFRNSPRLLPLSGRSDHTAGTRRRMGDRKDKCNSQLPAPRASTSSRPEAGARVQIMDHGREQNGKTCHWIRVDPVGIVVKMRSQLFVVHQLG